MTPQTTTGMRAARWADLDPGTAHDLVRLRIEVFVVEQRCPYPELDGRDVEPTTRHLWWADESGVASYLRVLAEPDGSVRVGRVCTRADARGRGLSGELVAAVLGGIDAVPDGRDVVLDAQSHLQHVYARFGFTPAGPEFVEDGIPHLPMVRRAP